MTIMMKGAGILSGRSSQWLQQLVFIGPSVLFFSIILVVPFILGGYYSFTEWNGISADPEWVGWSNWHRVLTDDDTFLTSFLFTVRYSVTSVVLVNLTALCLAVLITRTVKLKGLYRTVYFIPNVIGGLLLGYIFQFIFVKGFPALGELTGIPTFLLPWLGTSATAFWGVIIVSVWHSAGYMMIIYIAGILNIPSELVEAAHMDGAGSWRVLKHITLPLLMPAFTICLFLTISTSFKAYDQILSLTGGGPFKSTEVVTMDIFNEAFQLNNMGLGSAKALIFFVIVAAITLVQVWLTKRKEVEA